MSAHARRRAERGDTVNRSQGAHVVGSYCGVEGCGGDREGEGAEPGEEGQWRVGAMHEGLCQSNMVLYGEKDRLTQSLSDTCSEQEEEEERRRR